MQPLEIDQEQEKRTRNILLLIGIIFVAFNLRPSITTVGPLISDIRLDTGISNGVAGLLTTLPLLGFAFLSPFAPKIAQKIGMERTVLLGLLLLTTGIFIRPTSMVVFLFLGTAFVGAGIAICNVLLPSIVKMRFATKVGLMTGLYTMSMNLVASLGSGVSVPLAHGLNLGWKSTFAVWGFLALATIAIWLPQAMKKNEAKQVPKMNPKNSSVWKSKIAWQVTIFMGLQSMLFFSLVAWLPEILVSRDYSQATAGWMVSIMQILGLPASLFAPILADRLPNQRGLVMIMAGLYFSGIGLLFFVEGNIFVLAISILFIGLPQGAGIGLSLTFLSLRTRTPQQAANLSGMAQSFGYFLAAVGPFMIGFIYDVFSSWNISLYLLLLVSSFMLMAGLGAGKNEYVTKEEN